MTSPLLSPPASPPLPVTVGALARMLQADDQGELEIEVPAGVSLELSGVTGASVEAGKLRFARLEDRNAVAAAEVLRELGDLADHEAVWTAARELWRHEIGNADMASGRLLALIHPQVNILRLAAGRITSQGDVFDALHLVEATLPYLDAIDLLDLVTLCDVEQPLTQGDLAGGNVYGALASWFRLRPAVAREAVEMLLLDPRPTRGNLLSTAWIAWFSADPQTSVRRLLDSDSRSDLSPLHDITCWIAGRMLAEPTVPGDLCPALEARILNRISDEDAIQRRAGLQAASALLHLRRAFDLTLRARIAVGDLEAAAFVMQSLARNNAALLQMEIFFDWLHLCVGLDEGFEGVLNTLDHSLSRLLRPGSAHVEPVISFLEAWIHAHPSGKIANREFAQRFDACTHTLLSQPDLLGRVFTNWMLSDGSALASAAASIVATARTRGQLVIAFDPALLDAASEADLRFLIKRMLGFLIEAEKMLSLTLSLLRLRNAKMRVFPLLRWSLQEEIGYDYPATTSKALRTQADLEEDAEIKDLLIDIATQLEFAMTALEALPRLRELKVSQSLRRDFVKARDKAMERSIREAQKRSILAQLASQVHIKAGETTFQYLGESFSEPMGFASHSVSFELPRREMLDPVGNTYRRLKLRATKRDQA